MEAERLRLVDSMTGVCLGSFVTAQLVGDFVGTSLVQAFRPVGVVTDASID